MGALGSGGRYKAGQRRHWTSNGEDILRRWRGTNNCWRLTEGSVDDRQHQRRVHQVPLLGTRVADNEFVNGLAAGCQYCTMYRISITSLWTIQQTNAVDSLLLRRAAFFECNFAKHRLYVCCKVVYLAYCAVSGCGWLAIGWLATAPKIYSCSSS